MGLFMMEEFNDSQDTVSCQREQLAGRNTPLANMLCGSISGIQPSSSSRGTLPYAIERKGDTAGVRKLNMRMKAKKPVGKSNKKKGLKGSASDYGYMMFSIQ